MRTKQKPLFWCPFSPIHVPDGILLSLSLQKQCLNLSLATWKNELAVAAFFFFLQLCKGNLFKVGMKWTQKTRTPSSLGHPCFPHWEILLQLIIQDISRDIHKLFVQPSTMFFSVFSLTPPWFHCTFFSFWLRWGPLFQDLALAATSTEINIKLVQKQQG